MNTQNQINRTLSEPTSIEYVRGLLENKEVDDRSELAALICQQAGFYDVVGQEQRSGCLKALRELEAAGHFALPPPPPVLGASRPGTCLRRFHFR